VSVSSNHWRPWGKSWCRALVRRGVSRTLSPTRRRRCAPRGARARRAGRWGVRGVSVSRGGRRSSSWRSASAGSSVAGLGVQAARDRARVRGVTGKRTRPSSWPNAETRGPGLRSSPRALGGPVNRGRTGLTHASRGSGWCARTLHARVWEPAACRQTSCVAAAQSRPTKAAHASVGRRVRGHRLSGV
jgi:hypothetical protein